MVPITKRFGMPYTAFAYPELTLFTLSQSQRADMWRCFQQTDDHRVSERLHAILVLDSGHNAESVCAILNIHPKTLKRWIATFVAGAARLSLQTTDSTPCESRSGGASDMGANLYRKKGALTDGGKVYFLDAAHLLHAAIPSRGWIKRKHTVQLQTNAGRNRLNMLGAYSPDDQDLISLEGRESCDTKRVVQLFEEIRAANPGTQLLVVLDNAPYNRYDKLGSVGFAAKLGLPPCLKYLALNRKLEIFSPPTDEMQLSTRNSGSDHTASTN